MQYTVQFTVHRKVNKNIDIQGQRYSDRNSKIRKYASTDYSGLSYLIQEWVERMTKHFCG